MAIPSHLLHSASAACLPRQTLRMFSTSPTLLHRSSSKPSDHERNALEVEADDKTAQVASSTISASITTTPPSRLTHLTGSGEAHMVAISHKASTSRRARAVCSVVFSGPAAPRLIRAGSNAKGDVLAVARIAGIMAAKRTPDIIPLCHTVMLSHVGVELEVVMPAEEQEEGTEDDEPGRQEYRVDIAATVECDGKTGVEMEALTAAAAAALTVYDMCKAVDKGMRVEGLEVVLKEGGKSGRWVKGTRSK